MNLMPTTTASKNRRHTYKNATLRQLVVTYPDIDPEVLAAGYMFFGPPPACPATPSFAQPQNHQPKLAKDINNTKDAKDAKDAKETDSQVTFAATSTYACAQQPSVAKGGRKQ